MSTSALILGAIGGDGQGQRSMDELGISMPRMARAMASTPADVADAVVQAIKRDRAIVVVMPGPGGVLKSLMDAFPGLGPRMNEMGGATALVKRMAALRAQTPVSGFETEQSAA